MQPKKMRALDLFADLHAYNGIEREGQASPKQNRHSGEAVVEAYMDAKGVLGTDSTNAPKSEDLPIPDGLILALLPAIRGSTKAHDMNGQVASVGRRTTTNPEAKRSPLNPRSIIEGSFLRGDKARETPKTLGCMHAGVVCL